MGNQASHFLPEESQLLAEFSSERALAFDDSSWIKMLNFKQSLNSADLTPGILFRDMKGYLERLVRNDKQSKNVATLMALVAVRLPRAHYFSSTDLELTINAVVLLRLILRFFMSQLTAAELSTHLGAHANPAKTRNPDLEKVSGNFPAFVAANLDFLAVSPLKDEQHIELHTQVLTLVLTLLSTQLVEPDVLAAASLLTGEPALASADPGLAATMALGSQPVGSLTGAAKAALPSTAAPGGGNSPNPSRAAVLIGALLRNIAVDGSRDEDFEPAPPENSTAFAASKLVDAARGLAYKAAASSGNTASPLPSSVTNSSEAKAIANWGSLEGSSAGGEDGGLMTSVMSAASTVASLPASIILPAVGVTSAIGPGGDLPRPLAERSALLLLLLAHNARSGLAGILPLRNAAETGAAAGATPSTPTTGSTGSNAAQDAEVAALQRLANPYRYCLSCMQDSEDPSQSAAISLTALPTPAAAGSTATSTGGKKPSTEAVAFPSGATAGLRVKFRSTFLALKNLLNSPLGTVLFYTLMHGCPAFAEFTLSRSDADENVVLPLCKQLYYAGTLSPEHRYMLIIALLLLSQDASFCENAHRRIKVKGGSISWFGERRLGGEISLGSLLVILLVRLITAPPVNPSGAGGSSSAANAAGSTSAGVASDAYLHSNVLAVLANMAPHFHSLNVYASQKLVGMLGTLHKRHVRASQKLKHAEAAFEAAQAQERASSAVATSAASPAAAGTTSAELAVRMELLQSEVTRLDSAVRVCLETLHAAFHPGNLSSNLTLLYQLLHARSSVLAPVASDPAFSEDASGVADIAAHFSEVLKKEEEKRAIEAAKSGSGGPSSSSSAAAAPAEPSAAAPAGAPSATVPVVWEEEDVEAVLSAAVMTWKGGAPQAAADAAQALREAKFAYEEDSSPEVFFCPFLWSLTLQFTSDCGWWEFERDAAVPTRLIPLHPAVGLYPAVPLPATASPNKAKPKASTSAAAATATPASASAASISAGASAVAATGGAGATPLAAAV